MISNIVIYYIVINNLRLNSTFEIGLFKKKSELAFYEMYSYFLNDHQNDFVIKLSKICIYKILLCDN